MQLCLSNLGTYFADLFCPHSTLGIQDATKDGCDQQKRLRMLYLLLWYQSYQSHITYLIRSPCQWKKHTETFYKPVNCLLEVAAWWWLVASIFPMRWHWPVVRHWWDQVVAQLGVVISIIRFQIWLPSIVWNYTSWLITLTELIAWILWFTVVISPDNKWSWVYKPWILSLLKGAPR